MGLLNGLKKTLQESAESVKKSAENVKKTAENLPGSAKNLSSINMADSLNNLKTKGENTLSKLKSDGENLVTKAKDSLAGPKEANEFLRPEDALKIVYLLISSDQEISPEEEEMFESIGRDIDPEFETHKDPIREECLDCMKQAVDVNDLYDLIRDKAAAALQNSRASSEGTIQPRILLWNLISIAFADSGYVESERRMIRSMARGMDIDISVMLEMENSMQTLLALQKEETFLRNSDRKYAEVEVQVNELADRRRVIMESLGALMTD